MPTGLNEIIRMYIEQVKISLGKDFDNAVLYGSCARNEYTKDSDVDIAIFTEVPASDFYKLADKISESTFEFSVKHDIMLSPVFVNVDEYRRMLKVLPYYQNIHKEGIAIG